MIGYVSLEMTYKNKSIESYFGLFNISRLFLWKVHKIDRSLIRYDSQSIIFDVEPNSLEFFIYFNLGKAKITVPILVQNLHECQAK